VKPIIIGVDPGTTVGLCVLDFKGSIQKIFSKKNISQSKIIEEILKEGRPIIIATDKKKIPEYILDLGSSLRCRIYAPQHDLKSDEKSNIVLEWGLREKVKDDHQKDACASALFAYKRFRESIERIRKEIKREELPASVFHNVFVDNKNIKQAIMDEKVMKQPSKTKERKRRRKIKTDSALEKKYRSIRNQIEVLEKKNSLLQDKIQSLSSRDKNKLQKIKEEVRKVVRNNDAERKLLRILLENIRRNNSELKRRLKERKDDLKRLSGLAIDASLECCWYCEQLKQKELKRMNLEKNNQIIVKEINPIKKSIVKEMAEKETRILYFKGNRKEIVKLRQQGINILNIKGLRLTIFKNLAFFKSKAMEKIIKSKSMMENIIEEYRNKRLK